MSECEKVCENCDWFRTRTFFGKQDEGALGGTLFLMCSKVWGYEAVALPLPDVETLVKDTGRLLAQREVNREEQLGKSLLSDKSAFLALLTKRVREAVDKELLADEATSGGWCHERPGNPVPVAKERPACGAFKEKQS
jgi:hypothetical protein